MNETVRPDPMRDASEAERLRALRALDIVGSEPEPQFDAVCSLAQTFFNVPTVLISLIEEDYQWFKARCGLEAGSTSRDVSFCDHVIRSDDVMVVEDATKDARFAANPLVTGSPFIRFYSGAPLILAPGVRVGTLCVIDSAPRTFSEKDRQKLQDFATIVVALLRLYESNTRQRLALVESEARETLMRRQAEDLARRDAELNESNRLLLLAEEMMNAGHWRLELPSRRRIWSPEVFRIFGLAPDDGAPDLDDTFNGYHPDDRNRVSSTVQAAIRDQRPFSFDSRICRPDGSIRHVEVRGICEGTVDQEVRCLFGVVIDVTDRKRSEDRLIQSEHELTAVLDNMPAVIGYVGKDFRIRFANKKYREWYRKAPDQIAGVHVRKMIGEDHFRENLPYMEAALRGVPQQFERPQSAHRYVVASYIPDIQNDVVDGFFVLVMDITERKLSEDKLRASRVFEDRAGRIAGIGSWELDLASKVVTFSEETRRIYGVAADQDLDLDMTLAFYPPEARLLAAAALQDSIRTAKPWDLELPLVTAQGKPIWVRSAGEAEFADDKPIRVFGVFQDITSRRRTESLVRENETQYRLLAEYSSDMIVRIDLSGKRLFVSPSSQSLLGYRPDELIGTYPEDSIHPDDRPRFAAMRAGLIAGARDEDAITNRLRHKSGHYVWVEAKWRVLRDGPGQATEFIASIRDVSARREAEERLQASETLYRTLADSLPQMVWIVTAGDRTAVYANERYQAYYGCIGLSRDARVARNHPDDLAHMETTWDVASREGRTFEVEGRLRRHDGIYRWHKVVATPVVRNGAIVEWLGTALDIDDIILGRQKLKETSDLLSLSQDAAGAGFFDLDLLSGKVVLSRESAAMHGLSDDGIVEFNLAGWRACVDPEDGPRVLRLVEEACIARATYAAEFRVPLSGGRVRWIHGMGRAQYDHTGRAVRMIGLNFDVTERKASEAKLIEAIAAAETARREAEEASAAKSDFLASMSHEIRTPLNSIIGYTDILLEDEPHDAADNRKLELIRDAGSALLSIVNDILDFSKIEAGEIELDPTIFSLTALIDNVLSMISGLAAAKRLKIERDLARDLPDTLFGDAARLRQVLLNLLNNAVKFTAEGTVRLVVVRETSAPESCRLRFIVTDTGIGIPPDRRTRLFQRFSQVDQSIARRFGGTGLGLAISKRLVEKMGGEIGVASTEGLGSSFWFLITLPLSAPRVQPVTATPHDVAETVAAHVLLVEDVIVNQDLARLILQAGGHSVEVASDGVEAIQMVRKGGFDLVLMDVQMPGMDGLTATRRIRALNEPCHSVPIIAMTANVLPQQVAAFKAAGMDDHVGKPFKRAELYATVARWTRKDKKMTGARETFDRTIFDELREILGDAMCEKLVRKFASEVDERFSHVHGDVDRVRLAADAHALISPAGSLGFIGFSDLCREIELTAREGRDLDSCIETLAAARGAVLQKAAALL